MTGAVLFTLLKLVLNSPFEYTVFIPTLSCALVTWIVSLKTVPEDAALLDRFYAILNTPVGQDARLQETWIKLPAMINASPEKTASIGYEDTNKIHQLYEFYAQDKIFGPTSNIELRRE